MKKRSIDPGGTTYLRMKAEEQLKKRKDKVRLVASKDDMLKLIHELEVHQIELELQSEELILANNQARAASEKFEELYDFAPSGYFTLSRQGTILEMNLCSARILGKARSLLINSRFDSFIRRDSRSVFKKFLKEIFQGRSQAKCELSLLSDNNSRLHLHLTGIISENTEHCHVTATDITERKLLEEGVREKQEKFKVLAEVALTGIFTTDPFGNNTYVSPQWSKITGISPDEAKGNGWSQGLHPDDRGLIMNDWKLIGPTDKPKTYDFRFIRPDGSIVWVLSQATVVKDSDGKIIEWIGTITDITERKKAEEALRMNEDLLNASQRLSKTGGWSYNIEKKTMYWTEETYRLHDIAPGEIEPGSAEHIKLSSGCYRQEDRLLILKAFQRCLKKGQPYDFEFPFTSVKGRQIWIRTSAEPVIENGKTTRIIGNITDITERKMVEIEIEKSKELLTNLNIRMESVRENERADISREIHDQLGQSLTALKIDLMSLRAKMKTESTEDTVLGGMIKMVNSISRDVQRISSELRPLMLDDLGLAVTLEWYCEEFAGRTGLKVDLDIEDIQSENIDKDLALYRVAQESLTNIIRHARAGMVQVSLHIINDNLVLTIHDDGIGISKDKIESYKSLGLLGMSERVKQYEGKLEIMAPDKNGTIIRASIPIY